MYAEFFEITPQKLADSPKWIAVGLGALGVGLFVYLAVIAVRHILSNQKPHISNESTGEQSADFEEDHYGTETTTHVDHGDRSAPRSESRSRSGVMRVALRIALASWVGFSVTLMPLNIHAQGRALGPSHSEKVSSPVSQLIKDLRMGITSKKSKALSEIAERLMVEEGAMPDAEILTRRDEIVPLLFGIMKNPFGGKLSDEVVVPLAWFAKHDPEIVDRLLGEIEQDKSSNRLLSIRVMRIFGTAGPLVKGKAAPVLAQILRELKRNTYTIPFINESAIALALLGGPYDKDLLPDAVKGMMSVKDPGIRLSVALKILEDPSALGLYAKYLEPVLVEGFKTQDLEEDVRQNILRAFVKIGTPNAMKIVFDLLLLPSKSQKDRVLAAKALLDCQQPSPEVLEVLVSSLRAKHFLEMVGTVCDTLSSYGFDARPTLPGLRAILKDLVEGAYPLSQERKAYVQMKIKETIRIIESAKNREAFVPATNQVPQQVPQGEKRSESRAVSPDADMSSDGTLGDAEQAVNEMDAAMALQVEHSLGHLEIADVAGNSANALAEMDEAEGKQLRLFKEAALAAQQRAVPPRTIIVGDEDRGSVISFLGAHIFGLPVERIWIAARDHAHAFWYTLPKTGDLWEGLRRQLDKLAITDVSQLATVELEMESPYRRSEMRQNQLSPRREKWIRAHERLGR